jgi:Icc-related predicted phosphoesterase
MRFLVVANLYARRDWWDWLCSQARGYDAVLIAGDLIDIPSQKRSDDLIKGDRACAEVACARITRDGGHVFLAQGNHDGVYSWPWLKSQLGRHRLGNVLFHGLPNAMKPDFESSLQESQDLARETGLCWIVLDHYPPLLSKTYGKGGNVFGAQKQAIDFSPDIIVSGHRYEAPFSPEGSWHDTIGKTLCLNPGLIWDEPVPCHIVLDTTKGEATWITAKGTETFTFPISLAATQGGMPTLAVLPSSSPARKVPQAKI